MSKRVKREIVSVAAVLSCLLIYFLFNDYFWAIYATVCAGYTVVVFGMLWSDGKWARYIAEGKRTPRELIQGHLTYVLALALWIWICRFATPWLPDWLFNLGPRELTLYLIFSGLGIVAIWWAEQSWLAKVPKTEDRSESLIQR